MNSMQEVTQEQFYRRIKEGGLDVHPWPRFIRDPDTGKITGMCSLWKFRDGRMFGKTVFPFLPRAPRTYNINETEIESHE